jgi:hypothetical protein
MPTRVIFTCLSLLLSSVLLAQSNPPTQTQQPAAGAQVQANDNDKAASNTQADSTKKDDSDQGRHKLHVRLGGISVGAGYFSNPFFFGPFEPYGFYPYSLAYSPFFYDPFSAPFYGPYVGGFAYAPDKGEVQLKANPKNAQVFLDGAYAGTADHLKNMWLESGAYNLSVSAPGREDFQKRIYVLSGKSLKIDAKLAPGKNPKSQTEEKP